jgi:hypothetical protein
MTGWKKEKRGVKVASRLTRRAARRQCLCDDGTLGPSAAEDDHQHAGDRSTGSRNRKYRLVAPRPDADTTVLPHLALCQVEQDAVERGVEHRSGGREPGQGAPVPTKVEDVPSCADEGGNEGEDGAVRDRDGCGPGEKGLETRAAARTSERCREQRETENPTHLA